MLYNMIGCMAIVCDAKAMMQCCDVKAMMQCCDAKAMMQQQSMISLDSVKAVIVF